MAFMTPMGRQSTSEIIKLNVGGVIYTTSRSTLTKYPDSMLGTMFSGRIPTTIDEHGNYWIDGNGDMFRYVLDFLRRGRLIIPEHFQDWELLECEGDFYQIREFTKAVKSRFSVRNENQCERKVEENLAVILNASSKYAEDQALKIYGPRDVISQLYESLRCRSCVHVKSRHDWEIDAITAMIDEMNNLHPTRSVKFNDLNYARGGREIIIDHYNRKTLPIVALKLELLNLGFSMSTDVPDKLPTSPGEYTYWFKRPKGNSN